MFINRIELFGFKSFKNKTVLEFTPQEITGIVGPNGCGKSNILDAVLWVMGESAPKRLRGEASSDVIFGGTAKEVAGNIAEVSMTLGRGNQTGEAGFPDQYKDFSELLLTRRAFRDGKNEYFINQQPCLLRDIRELFMNTGAGCRGFSIIEQESIERLITAKPLGRRFIIEETAGIVKFKTRKREVAQKLELVRQNLHRVDDILKMQEARLSSLASQAKKAERYRELKREIEKREKQIEDREKERLYSSYQQLKFEKSALKQDRLKQEHKKILLEEKIKKEKHRLESLQSQEGEKRAQLESLMRSIQQTEMEKEMEFKALKMISLTEAKKKALDERASQLQKELASLQSFFKSETEQKDLEQKISRLENSIQAAKSEKTSAELNAGVLKKQIKFVEKEMEVLKEEKKSVNRQIQTNIHQKNKLQNVFKKQKQMSLNFENEAQTLSGNEEKARKKKEEAESRLSKLNQKAFVLEHKIKEMKNLLSRFEGMNEGALDLRKWKPELFSSLSQSLKVDPDGAVATSAVLGQNACALISLDGMQGIEQALERLKNSKKGKTAFFSSLPVPAPPASSLKQELKARPAFICFLDEKIKWTDSTKFLKPFFEQIAVVSDLNSAFELKKQLPLFQFVTPEGDFINRDSLVYAGSSEGDTGLFQIRSQIESCLKELSSKKIQLKVERLNLSSCEKRWKGIQAERQSTQDRLLSESEELIGTKKDIEQLEKDLLRLSKSREGIHKKLLGMESEKKNLIQHGQAFQAEIKEWGENLSERESERERLLAEKAEYETWSFKKSRLEGELLEKQRSLESLNQETTFLLNLSLSSSSKVNADQTGDPSSANTLSSKTLALDFDVEERVRRVLEEKQKLSSRLKSLQREQSEHSRKRKEQEKALQEEEKSIFQIKMAINELKSGEEKKELEKTYLKNNFLEHYGEKIEAFSHASLSEGDVPLSKLKAERDRLNKSLDKIREVNFLALDEYEKLSKENFFLSSQRGDLVNSRKELSKVISHIDKLCEARFMDMLLEINKRFSKVFPIVFQGENARAELILDEPAEEGAERGVDILIHPPGKKPQSVSLLSRGEKALTSICLIYSLFLVKPSPFCIIDEADAPLDDANIFKFISIIKEMACKSQIIIITHNKYSMQACAKLYGVTAESPGISQIVSVDMKKSEEEVADL